MNLKNFQVEVRKITDETLMREACEMTFLGKSHQSLKSMYRSEHSPVRTQIFWITLKNIPLFVSTHFIRHHVGSQPFQLTCRDDREGGNPGLIKKIDAMLHLLQEMRLKLENGVVDGLIEDIDWLTAELCWIQENTDRYTPVNLGILVNAQSLIDMAKLRECMKASRETRLIFSVVKEIVAMKDPDLAMFMVPKCIYCGGLCHETRCCGYNKTEAWQKEFEEYTNQAIGKSNMPAFMLHNNHKS